MCTAESQRIRTVGEMVRASKKKKKKTGLNKVGAVVGKENDSCQKQVTSVSEYIHNPLDLISKHYSILTSIGNFYMRSQQQHFQILHKLGFIC